MNDELTILHVAKRAGVGVETVRLYERQRLLARPARRPSGYRRYDPSVVSRFRFIRRAKGLGLTLREINELLDLRFDPSSTCGDVKERPRAKLTDIDAKITTLRRVRNGLPRLMDACDSRRGTWECPFLDALEDESEH